MSEAATTAESGPLSIDQAVEALRAPDPDEQVSAEAPEEAAEETQSEAEPTAEEGDDPETPAIEAEEEAEPESDPEAPAIAAPKSWDAEERALFATLPPKAQETILARETERDKAVSKAMQEASEARSKVEQEVAGVVQFKERLTQTLTNAETVFADKWSDIDWAAWMSQDFEAATIAKFQHDQEASELKRIAEAKTQAETVAFQSYVKAEAAKLPTVAPELADPKEGPARQQAVGKFLLDVGYSADQLRDIGALDLAMAYDAMRWRQAQAKPATATPAKTTPAASAPRRTATQATAPPARTSTTQQQASAAFARLSKTGSVDDAVAFLTLRG